MIRPQSFSLLALLFLIPSLAFAEPGRDNSPTPEALQQQMDKLVALLAQEESALKDSQQRIQELRKQVVGLQSDIAGLNPTAPARSAQQDAQEAAARLDAQVSAIREQQELQQSEIATHEQTKVESASRFPLKLTGLILMNAFSNTSWTDSIQSPTVTAAGSGSAGLTIRQSIVGLDARGPHVFGATSAADLRVDFFGNPGQGSYTNAGGTARFRTAHAELAWPSARAFVELDRPVLNPNAPDSLTAVAQPALAWSGNLWSWIPQAGAEYSLSLSPASRIQFQAALADVPDPPSLRSGVATAPSASLAEQSRRPGTEARVGYASGDRLTGLQIGVGGYFSPHRQGNDFRFNAWAATLDYRLPVSRFFEISGNVYRGAALGGLGAGAFKDYIWRHLQSDESYHALDDVGGWAQLKARAGERLEFNGGYGLDNAFVNQIRPYLTPGSGFYSELARNSTFLSNVIYSPTAYTLFSAEYRRINSSMATGGSSASNVYGLAAGYRF